MKKILTLAIISILAVSCGQEENKQKELEKLQAEYAELGKKIDDLKKEIAAKGDSGDKVVSAVKVVTLTPMVFKRPVEIQGMVESDQNVLVSAEVPGRVVSIAVKEGQRVSKGQLLARIDGDITASSIAEVENALKFAETNYQRQKKLRAQNVGTEMQLLQAENQRDALQKQLQTLRTQYGKYNLTSPISGTVESVSVNMGESVMPGLPIMQVVDNTNLEVKAAVSEKYVKAVKAGDSVIINFPSINERMPTKISAVGQVINPNNRTFSLSVNLIKPSQAIKPNLLAMVTIYDYVNPKAIAVPSNVIFTDGSESYVYVAETKGNKTVAKRVTVKTGETAGGYTEILSGLEAGDRVAVENVRNLMPGDELTIVK